MEKGLVGKMTDKKQTHATASQGSRDSLNRVTAEEWLENGKMLIGYFYIRLKDPTFLDSDKTEYLTMEKAKEAVAMARAEERKKVFQQLRDGDFSDLFFILNKSEIDNAKRETARGFLKMVEERAAKYCGEMDACRDNNCGEGNARIAECIMDAFDDFAKEVKARWVKQ